MSEALGMRASLEFCSGKRVHLKARTDSSAARGMMHRQGLGKAKHIQTRFLWLQEVSKNGLFSIHPVGTKLNPADLGTKSLAARRLKFLLNGPGFKEMERRRLVQNHEEKQREHLGL